MKTESHIDYGKAQVFDQALPVALYQELLNATARIGWQFGWNTPSNPSARYWHHEVGHGLKDNTLDVSAAVARHPLPVFSLYLDWWRCHVVAPETRVVRCYLNAHTFGTDGWPHTDTERTDELTSVLYLTPEWKNAWCGETVVFNGAGEIEAAVLPRANRLLAFPADRLHAPRPLSKSFEGLRVVLVLKLASAHGPGGLFDRVLGEEEMEHAGAITQAHAQHRTHGGRSLLQHLWATYRLLALRGADPELCLAGLYHSYYSTVHARVCGASERAALRGRIGDRAERLAWLFGVLARPQCWSQPGPQLPLRDGGTVAVKDRDRLDLVTLERANLDEQGILALERRAGLG